jgi:hypothetical protein
MFAAHLDMLKDPGKSPGISQTEVYESKLECSPRITRTTEQLTGSGVLRRLSDNFPPDLDPPNLRDY